jgi:hypothetical protein
VIRIAMRPLAAALMVVALGACAGGGASPAERAVSETGERLADISSGELTIRILTGGLENDDADTGFELRGPFDVDDDPPTARFTYTQFVAGTEQTSIFTTTGGASFVEVDGVAYELDDDRAGQLEIAGPLEGLNLSAWLIDPTITGSDGGIERIEAQLDTPIVIRDLVTLSAGDGAPGELAELAEEDADAIRRAARTARATLETGSEDRLLHRLSGVMEFSRDPDTGVRIPGGRFEFAIEISDHDGAVTITPPANPRPISELPEPQPASSPND